MGKHLTSKLFIPILLLSFLTFGFLFNPFAIDKDVGVNGYLIIVIGFLITSIGLLALKSLAAKYPDQSIIGLGNTLPGPLAKIGTALWLLAVFLLTATLAKTAVEEIATLIMFRTPKWVSVLVYFGVVGYMASLGEEALGRLSSILTAAVPVFLILLALSFREISFLNIHPVNICRDLGYLRKWDLWLIAFAPVWILSPFSGNPSLRYGFPKVLIAIAGGALMLGATSLAIAGAFGPEGIKRYEWPVVSLMNITPLAFSYFFQNIPATIYIFISLALSLVAVAAFLTVLTKGLLEFSGLKKIRLPLILFLMIAGLLALTILPNLINFIETANLTLKAGSLYTPFYVLLIWFGSLWRRKDQK